MEDVWECPPVQPDERTKGHGVCLKGFSGQIGMRGPQGTAQSVQEQLAAELPSRAAYCPNTLVGHLETLAMLLRR